MPKDDDPNASGGAEKANDAKQNPGQSPTPATGASAFGQSGERGATGAQGRDAETSAQSEPNASGQRASALLKADHQQVEKLFAEFESADDRRKSEIIRPVRT